MSGPQPLRTPARWLILRALVSATEPLDNKQLSDLVGLPPGIVRDALKRPRKAQWVTVSKVPATYPYVSKYLYTITDRGRQALFEYLATADKEG